MNSLWVGIARILDAAASEARAIAAEETMVRLDWVPQTRSPLGSRTHIAAVRRRLKEGLDGAGQAGRKYLLSPAALAQELASRSETRSLSTSVANASEVEEVAELRSQLALIRGGSR